MAEQELTHHGVEGMKWGVRRYQPYTGVGKGKFLGKTKPKKTPVDTKGLSLRDANAKRRIMASTTKGKKTVDVNPTAKAKLDKINTKQKVANSKQKTKLSINKGSVDGKTLVDEVFDNMGVMAVSSLAGGYLVSIGKVELGAIIGSIGNTVAVGNIAVDVLLRTSKK